MLANPTYNMANSQLVDTSLSLAFLAVLGVGCVVIHQDWTHSLHVLSFASDLKHNRIEYPLNAYNMKRYAKRVNIFTKYFVSQPIVVLFILVSLFYIIETINTLTEFKLNLQLINVIVNFIIWEFGLYTAYGGMVLGFVICIG